MALHCFRLSELLVCLKNEINLFFFFQTSNISQKSEYNNHNSHQLFNNILQTTNGKSNSDICGRNGC
jgi:hypothetical protein